MTSDDRVYLTRLGIFKLHDAGKHTVKEICEIYNYSRTWFYKLLARRKKYGEEGLKAARRKPETVNNKTPLEDELKVLDFIQKCPAYGPARVSQELALPENGSLKIGHTAVYGIMKRHNLNTRKKRLEWVRKLSGEVVKLSDLQRDKERSKTRHIQAYYPGQVMGADLFYVGCLKNIGRLYQFTYCDCFSSFGLAKLYVDKTADSAVNSLENHVLPSTRVLGVPIHRLLHDNGKEFTTHWPTENHKFKEACRRNHIEQTLTKVKHPWTNGYVERLNQTILDEFYSVVFRKKIYTSVEELQRDLDEFMHYYNFKRTHQGYKLKQYGYKVPAQAFLSGRRCLALPLAA